MYSLNVLVVISALYFGIENVQIILKVLWGEQYRLYFFIASQTAQGRQAHLNRIN